MTVENADPGAEQLHQRVLLSYIAALIRYARWKVAVAFGVLILVGLTEGMGLLLLVPFLNLLDLSGEGAASGGVAAVVNHTFEATGLPATLPVILCIYVGLVVCRALLVRWREVLLMTIQLGFVDYLRIRLYQAIGRANWLFLSSRRTSDFTHVLASDINRVAQGTYFFLEIIVVSFLAAVHIGVALQLSAPMTLLALVIGGCLLLVLWPQVRRARALGAMLTEADRQLFGTASQFLEGIKLAKSYGAEERHQQAFTESVTTLRQRMLDFFHSNARARLIFQMGAALAISGLIYIAAVPMHLPTAELLVLVLIFARLLPLLSQLQRNYQYFVHMLPAFASAMRTWSRCQAEAEPPLLNAQQTLLLEREICFQDVYFRYDKQVDKQALKGIDLVIAARKTTALVGPSGSGKSTLADLLMGLLTPDDGRILLDGESLHAGRVHAWRCTVAYVPQETFLFHDTVRANLLWTRPDSCDEELWQALRLAAAEQFVAELPQGLDTVVGERGVRLSGGERQRIALARALLRQPSLLILDEATSALDTEHERRIQQAIDELHGELTIVVIAHRLSTVCHADRIIVLDAGQVVEAGTWSELSVWKQGQLHALLKAAAMGVDTGLLPQTSG